MTLTPVEDQADADVALLPGAAHVLFWYALALPLIHFAGYQTLLLDDASQPARRVLVAGYIMLSGLLILYYQRTLESRQHRLLADVEQMDEQLQQSRRMESLGRLAGGVAHDFNNLLMVIHGYSQILREGLQDNVPLALKAEEIQKAADRAASLTGQLLAFSRKQVLQTQVFDLNDIVGETAQMLRRLIGENIQVLLLPSPDPARVQADPGQIGQVIVNLALNARDAMPEGGRLTIAVTALEVGEVFARRFRGMKPGDRKSVV